MTSREGGEGLRHGGGILTDVTGEKRIRNGEGENDVTGGRGEDHNRNVVTGNDITGNFVTGNDVMGNDIAGNDVTE